MKALDVEVVVVAAVAVAAAAVDILLAVEVAGIVKVAAEPGGCKAGLEEERLLVEVEHKSVEAKAYDGDRFPSVQAEAVSLECRPDFQWETPSNSVAFVAAE
jgi:hypothetical protein